MTIYWKCIHSHVEEFFFIWTDLEKLSITSLAHQWIVCSEWVPSVWVSKQLINQPCFEHKKRFDDEFISTKIQHFSSQDINWSTEFVMIICGLLWCFYQLFGLSFWRHPFTAEDTLVSKWCNAKFSKSFWWKMAWGVSILSYFFVNYSSSCVSDIRCTLPFKHFFFSFFYKKVILVCIIKSVCYVRNISI